MFDLNISSVTIKHQFTDTILVTYESMIVNITVNP